jgi:hypothetical protein
MAKAIRFQQPGSTQVPRLETIEAGTPAAGQVRLLCQRDAPVETTRDHFDFESRRITGRPS